MVGTSVKILPWILFLLQLYVPLSESIIPKPCVDNVTTSKVCCPSSFGDDGPHSHHHHRPPCGGPHRGFCAPVEVFKYKIEPQYRHDDRVHWPLHVFTHVCQCHGNFFGIACHECWFGWEGKNCDRRSKVRVRKNWIHMTPREKDLHLKVLTASFYMDSDYYIMVEQDNWRYDPMYKPIFVPANWHYFFVFMHRYPSRTTLFTDKDVCERYGILDFNHNGPGFPSWHRYFMMYWERVLQQIAWKEFGDDEYAFPYWNWTDETECGVCRNDMAGDVGPVDMYGQRFSPRSPFYNWTEYCSEPTDNAICYGCHYSGTYTKLNRRWNNNIMPTTRNVEWVMSFRKYYDRTEQDGEPCKTFRMSLEGFCGPPGVNDSRQYMHNFVHNSVDGSMCCIATATGDPLFIVHHTEVDRFYEAWLRDNKPDLYDFPNTDVPPGHCRECFLTGVLPPVKHADIFPHSSLEFGYTYDNFIFGKRGRRFGTGHKAPPVKYTGQDYLREHPQASPSDDRGRGKPRFNK